MLVQRDRQPGDGELDQGEQQSGGQSAGGGAGHQPGRVGGQEQEEGELACSSG
ncbi:hypothetical protein SLI_3469 [Streptomyces lividans 1326]|uniref:Uncharacterized protein n=1 Tax=Streptomyces lividans 1326 TaxID=1200984 RepID=A0A7U9DS92_STRLI|nr:hypothetical protein SLI_3469 [Streptomyces lividans 1326]